MLPMLFKWKNIAPLIEDIKLALEIISEYLSDRMESKLLVSYGMTAADFAPAKSSMAGTKRKTDWEDALEVRRSTLFCS
jgi:hypothetical protein